MSASDHDHFEGRIAQAIAPGLRVAADMIEDALADIEASSSELAPAMRTAASDAANVLARLEPVDASAEDAAPAPAPIEAVPAPPKRGPVSISPERLRDMTVGGLSPSEFRRVAAMDAEEYVQARAVGFAPYLRGVAVDEPVPANSSAVAPPVSSITPTSAQVGVSRFVRNVADLTMEAAE